MGDFWERAFVEKQLMWGEAPTGAALVARDIFVRAGVRTVLIPGLGYGRNAVPFLESGISVSGIEISETAIALARARLGLQIPIAHGSVTDMPFDSNTYDAVFCHGVLYLLDDAGREKLIRDCYAQLAPGGLMLFTVISKTAPMYGQGARLGEDRYERLPGLPMFFYDEDSVRRAFAPYGLVAFEPFDEPNGHGVSLPFFRVLCRRTA